MASCRSVKVIDLDDASTKLLTWDEHVPEHVFANLVERQLRELFQVSEEAWVDLIDLNNSSLVTIDKATLGAMQDPLCLCLSAKTEMQAPVKRFEVFEMQFKDKSLGMIIRELHDTVVVNQFKRNPDGQVGVAEASGRIQLGDIIYKVNGNRTFGRSYDTVVQMLQTESRPLSIQFFRPFPREGLFAVEFRAPNLNVTISTDEFHVIVKDLPMAQPNVPGYAESHGVCIGDVIHAVDGEVLYGPEYTRAVSLLSRSSRPLVVVFARSRRNATQLAACGTVSANLTANPHSVATNRFSFASTISQQPTSTNTNTNTNKAAAAAAAAAAATTTSTTTTNNNNNLVRHHNPMATAHLDARRGSTCSVSSGIQGDQMNLEEMLEYCDQLSADGLLTCREVVYLKETISSMRADACSAVRRKNRNAIIAIARSPFMRAWDHLLKSKESILLAGPVSVNRKKRYHLLLTNHERLLFVNKDSNLLEDEIMCAHIVTVSSRSKFDELIISTAKTEYTLCDTCVGPLIWVRAILPFTCTQGYLKVASSRFFLGSKKRFFLLQGMKLTGFKNESLMHQVGAKSSSIQLTDAQIEISDPKSMTFTIVTPEFRHAGKKLILTAPSGREFNKWVLALNAVKATTLAAKSA